LFPHHENERAQSLAANDGDFARVWVHNGFVTIDSEKMSKSLGNFLTIRDALQSIDAQVLRFFLLSKHYRSPLDFSKSAVSDLQSGIVRIYRTLQRLGEIIGEFEAHPSPARIPCSLAEEERPPFLEQFVRVMDDDMNTAGAVGLIFEKVKEMNRIMDDHELKADPDLPARLCKDRGHLFTAARVLGLLEERPEDFFKKLAGDTQGVDAREIDKLIEERARARSEKDWAGADSLRDRLEEMGIVLEDGPQGTTWRFNV
jgi:cysteinyl-tRNA synthetase